MIGIHHHYHLIHYHCQLLSIVFLAFHGFSREVIFDVSNLGTFGTAQKSSQMSRVRAP